MVSNLEVFLPNKLITTKNIDEALKSPHRKFCKEYLSVEYDMNKKFNLLLDLIMIKYFPGVTKVLRSIIATSIKEGDCYGECKFVSCNFTNGSSHIKGVDFDQYYSPVTYTDSFNRCQSL